MINMHDTSMQFWTEIINMTCYTANRVFLRHGTKKTSYKLWIGTKKTSYELWIGSECYILKDRENLDKFNSKSNLGIFLCYSNKSKTYKVYNQNTKVIQESSNVVINDFGYD